MATLPAGLVSEGSGLRLLREVVERPRAVLVGIGALLVRTSQRAFREQRMGKAVWKSRGETGMNPNWPAILADFAAGKSAPPERRFQDRPALVDRGDLKRSVTFRVVSDDTVEAGSNLPYAAVLHSGGESKTPTITKAIQDRLSDWIDKALGRGQRAAKRQWGVGTTDAQMARDAKAVKRGQVANKLQWLLNPQLQGQALTVRHPPRPIVGLPDELVREVESLFGVTIRKGA